MRGGSAGRCQHSERPRIRWRVAAHIMSSLVLFLAPLSAWKPCHPLLIGRQMVIDKCCKFVGVVPLGNPCSVETVVGRVVADSSYGRTICPVLQEHTRTLHSTLLSAFHERCPTIMILSIELCTAVKKRLH